MKTAFRATAAFLLSATLLSGTAMAAELEPVQGDHVSSTIDIQYEGDPDHVKVGDVIHVDGELESVVQVNADGSFVTIRGAGLRAISGCTHEQYDELTARGSQFQKVSNNSSTCYKGRTRFEAKCTRCSQVKTVYGKWSNYSHKYQGFNKQCSNTVNGTRCTYKKK